MIRVDAPAAEPMRRDCGKHLVDAWLPSLDAVPAKLAIGARVAVIGCGGGAATLVMAASFPESRFYGFDSQPDEIRRARRAAADAGLADRVHFAVAGEDSYPGTGYDLVAQIDSLHVVRDPRATAMHVRESLAPDGTWLVVEPLRAEGWARHIARTSGFADVRRASRTALHIVLGARPAVRVTL